MTTLPLACGVTLCVAAAKFLPCPVNCPAALGAAAAHTLCGAVRLSYARWLRRALLSWLTPWRCHCRVLVNLVCTGAAVCT